MTDEEITALQHEVETLRAANDDLTAERDSLRDENAELIAARDAAQTEAQETKKLNFTLARQLDTKPRQTADQLLVEMFGKRR